MNKTFDRTVHSKVAEAVRKGVLVKTACQDCGSNKDIEGHHEDYDKPLDVIWLCRKHHHSLHNERRRLSRKPVRTRVAIHIWPETKRRLRLLALEQERSLPELLEEIVP